jgi:hypothetical protein
MILVDAILELISIYIFSLPGAFIRWCLNGFQAGKFGYYLKKDIFINFFIFVVFTILIVFSIYLISIFFP